MPCPLSATRLTLLLPPPPPPPPAQGRTGYPLVDAAMRELWSSGWMHNRLRVVAASFLVKNLL